MAVRVQEVLIVDAVFIDIELLRNEAEVAAVSDAFGAEIIPDGLFIGGLIGSPPHTPPTQGRVLRLPRDRMTVETVASRTRVLREYPAGIEDVSLVAQLVTQAIAATDLQGKAPSSFGFNIQIVYDQDSGEPQSTTWGGVSSIVRGIFMSAGGQSADLERWYSERALGNGRWLLSLDSTPGPQRKCISTSISMFPRRDCPKRVKWKP